MARFAARTWELANGSFTFSAMDHCRRLGESFQRVKKRPRFRIRLGRCHNLQSTRRRKWAKRGAEAHAIGRSKGGLTTKIHAAVDALGMPIRFTITPGQWGDCPQAIGLIEGLQGVGHVMADAAYDADYLREFIANDLNAGAQIKQNPTRKTTQQIDWALYKERHLVECFFNRIKRFRRIALRCEKSISSFNSFVAIACTMVWLA